MWVEEEGDSRAQDESTLWVQILVLQAALQHSVVIILSFQTLWGQKCAEKWDMSASVERRIYGLYILGLF